MMGVPGIRWVCSHCGAYFPSRETLTAHVAAVHEGHYREDTATQDLSKPGVSPNDSELPADKSPQDHAGLSRQTEANATTLRSSEEPTSASTPVHPGGEPSEGIESHDLVKASISAITPEIPVAEPHPDLGLVRRCEPAPGLAFQPNRRTRASARRIARWVALFAISSVLAGLLVAVPRQITHGISLAVTRQPSPYTELYFRDPNALPTSLSLSGPNMFSFTVVNHEGHDTVYSYAVTLASSYLDHRPRTHRPKGERGGHQKRQRAADLARHTVLDNCEALGAVREHLV